MNASPTSKRTYSANFLFTGLGLILFAISSCKSGSEVPKKETKPCVATDNQASTVPPATAVNTPVYVNDVDRIFNGKCLGCHGPNVSSIQRRNPMLSTYAEVTAALAASMSKIQTGHPVNSATGALTTAEIQRLQQWQSAGTPQTSQNVTSTNKTAVPTNIVPGFDQDIAPLVSRYCVSCHQPNGRGKISFTTYAGTKPHAQAAINNLANGRMPPADAALRPNATEIDTFRRWVNGGSPQVRTNASGSNCN